MIVKNLKKIRIDKGFTVVELVVSIAIFALMTALLLAKYGTFNDGVLMTNLAYDVALTIRNAQSYSLNVKSAPSGGANYSDQFNYGYGVHFDIVNNKQIIFFVDTDGDQEYDSGEQISVYNLKRGSILRAICVGPTSCSGPATYSLDVSFKRPNPDAILFARDTASHAVISGVGYAIIEFNSSNGTRKRIRLNSGGQINVIN